MSKSLGQRDLVLVHVPAAAGAHYYVMQMAIGLVPLAEYVRQHGYSVDIVHVGLERLRSGTFSLAEHVGKTGASLVGFSAHWHWQLRDTLREAAHLKACRPGVKVVFGGLTASFFAEEILRHYDCVDFVIRGEAEVPLRKLLDHCCGDGDASSVPNLVWRQGSDVHANEVSYVATAEDLRSYAFGVSDAMHRRDLYLHTGIEDDLADPTFIAEPSAMLCGGRGCVHDCSFCSGSRSSVRLTTHRNAPAWLGWQQMSSITERCIRSGVRHFYLSADIAAREKEFILLLQRLRASVGPVRMDFEAWTLPSRTFLRVFRECTDSRSVLVLSPTCGSEEVRRANRSCFSTNEQYEAVLAECDDAGIRVWLYFTMGLPFESPRDVEETRDWQSRLSKQFHCVASLRTQPQQIEPGSPMFLEPERYRVRLLRRSLSDFASAGPLDGVGYDTEHFSADEIQELCHDARL